MSALLAPPSSPKAAAQDASLRGSDASHAGFGGANAAQSGSTKTRGKRGITISQRLWGLASLGLAGVLVVGIISIVLMNSLSDDTETVTGVSMAVEQPLNQLHQDQIKGRMITAQIAAADTDVARQKWIGDLAENDKAVQASIDGLNAVLSQGSPTFSQFLTDYDAYLQIRDNQLLPLISNGTDVGQYTALLDSTVQPAIDKFVADLDSVSVETQAYTQSIADGAKSSANRSIIIVSVIIVVVGVLLALLALRILAYVRRSINALRTSIGAMADGNLTVAADVISNDELGQTATLLNSARDSLTEILRGVGETTQAVAAASEELGVSGTQVAAGAEETSAQAGVVAAAAEQVSRNVQTVAAGSEQMGASIREIAQNASEAARVAAKATTVAEDTNRTVAKLGDSSKEIGDVIKTITSIAEQTNLLALNATIEAARAGEAGKGFAVVASEVKDLAAESARAAEDVARRVEAIQNDTAGAVDAISEISNIVASINDYQLTIASAVEEQTATTNEMNRSVAESATGANEIAANIAGVAAAAAQSSATVGQISAASSELATLSADLRTKVSAFTF